MTSLHMTPGEHHARFPSVSLASQADFIAYRRTAQDRLDARYSYETAQIATGETLMLPGTCALCLRRASFTADHGAWERRPDGRRVPHWDEALLCDCGDRLNKRARAVVHFAQSAASLRDWTRLLLFGPADPSHRHLAALAGETITCAALQWDRNEYRLDANDNSCHLAVAIECLHRVPPLDAAFAAFRRVLAPGGSLVFTVPFRHDSARTVSRIDIAQPHGHPPPAVRDSVHDIGWDVLDRLRHAGFATAVAHCYWSAELGYLGAFGMIFHAAR